MKTAEQMAQEITQCTPAERSKAAELLAAWQEEGQAAAWDQGHRANERDWQLTFDLVSPDEERVPWTNPYRTTEHREQG